MSDTDDRASEQLNQTAPHRFKRETTTVRRPYTAPEQIQSPLPIDYQDPEVSASARHQHHHYVLFTVLALLLIAILVIGFGVFQTANRISDIMSKQRDEAAELQSNIRNSNFDEAYNNLVSLSNDADSLRQETQGWVWRFGAALPGIGSDVTTAQTILSSENELFENGIQPIIDEYPQLKQSLQDGTTNYSDLAAVGAQIDGVHAEVENIINEIQATPSAHISFLNTAKDAAIQQYQLLDRYLSSADQIFANGFQNSNLQSLLSATGNSI